MSGILDRLVQNARAHLHDFLQRHVLTAPIEAPRQDADAGPHDPCGPLPRNAELADAYRLLDLPFGAPLADANRRWKTYLKRCHPDRFHADPSRQTEATELTQQLNTAYDLIETAWKNASRAD